MFREFWDNVTDFFNQLFKKDETIRMGCYGSPNAGKTTLANLISNDFLGEEVGKASRVPHETREVKEVEHVEMENAGKKLVFNLVDTPGIATKIDYEDFLNYNLKKSNAKKRAKEATKGVIEAIKWLDKMDVVLAVIDSSKDPYTQVNITILGNLEARDIPVIVVANKMDLKSSDVEKVEKMFPQYKVVGVSAKTGKNINKLYDAIFEVVK